MAFPGWSEFGVTSDQPDRRQPEERGLTRPGLPYDIHMRKPVGLLDTETRSLISKVDQAEIRDRIIRIRHAASLTLTSAITKTRLYAQRGVFPPPRFMVYSLR